MHFRRLTHLLLGCGLVGLAASVALGQPKQFRPSPDYVQIGKPDPAEGRRILEQFRAHGLYPDHEYVAFDLTALPRRGDERTVPGEMWVGRDDRGPVLRIVIAPGVVGQETRLLVQSGPEGKVWRWPAPAENNGQPLAPDALFQPLGGTDVSAFELQLSFLSWTEYVFEGVAKVRGRPAHVFLFYPPPSLAALRPELTGVRVYLDSEYNAPVQFEELGAEGKPTKTVSVMDLKKVDGQWLVKTIDFRNETTRDKSRFTITRVGLRTEFSSALFQPDELARAVAPPDASQLESVGP